MTRNRFYEYVELVATGNGVASTQTVFNFPDLPQLRTTPIYSIVVYTPNTTPLSGITFQPLVPVANLQNAFLTLYTLDPNESESKYGIDRIPLLELNYFFNATADPHVFYMPEFVGQTIVWPKSYITLAAAIGNTTSLVFAFGVRYGYAQKVQQ
jgi:hypothetical protein